MDIKNIIEVEFNFPVHSLTTLGQGLDSVAYLVNNEYVFKQAKHDEARANLRKEKLVLDYLRGKTTLQIPKIEFYSEEYHICGYKAIKGDKLTPELYKTMRDSEKDRLAQDIAMFLSQMHALPLPGVDVLQADVMDDYKSDYDALRKTVYEKIPDRSKAYLDALFQRIFSDRRITEYVKALCHNDLSCNHMIIQNNRVIGIIDFGDAAVTDRDKDFIYLLEDSREELGREFGMKVLEYYHHPNKELPILKADLNEEYYPIELILGGLATKSEDMYNKGLNKLTGIM